MFAIYWLKMQRTVSFFGSASPVSNDYDIKDLKVNFIAKVFFNSNSESMVIFIIISFLSIMRLFFPLMFF